MRTRLLLLLIIVLGASIRLYRLDAQGLWFDEAFSVAHSGRSLPQLFDILIRDVVQPPLHYLILNSWFDIAGYTSFQARLVSAVFGILSIPLLYLLAKRFTDTYTSLVAAFLLSISQIAIYFSQEARPYAQAQFFSLLSATTFLSFIERPDLRRSIAFASAATALIYTHYYGAGTLLALGIYWLIYRRDFSPHVFPRLTAVVAVLFLAFLPWFLAVKSGGSLTQKRLITSTPLNPASNVNPYSAVASLTRYNNGKFESIQAPTTTTQALIGFAVFTLPAAGALWYSFRAGQQGALLGILMAAIPLAMAMLCGYLGIIYSYRHSSFGVPGYYLAVALGWRACLRFDSVRTAWLLIVAALAALALPANWVPTKPDYRTGFLPMAKNVRSGDCVSGFPHLWHERIHFAWEAYFRDYGPLRLVQFDELPAAAGSCGRLWLVWDQTEWMSLRKDTVKASRDAIENLRSQYDFVQKYNHPDLELQLLERKPGGMN
jgi:predicted membrane-bound mannosyltransferase